MLSWKEIQDIISTNSLTPVLDTNSMSKILTWGTQWVSYDDEETHEFKRNFAKSNSLGGFMVWSIDQGSTSSQIMPMTNSEMKWYQCINYPEHCCGRVGTFCYPDCADGCFFQDILDDAQFFTISSANYVFHTWMTYLPDSLRIMEMSIPGTHDTAAFDTNLFALTQSMSISAQLAAGIRALDIRCRHIDNVFAMHHGFVFLHMSFGDVLNVVCEFLGNNPGEMVIMRIKEEHTEENNSRSFQETLDEYLEDPNWSSFFDTSSQLGTLGDHRGKIVLLNNHNCDFEQYGFCWGSAQIQDKDTLPLSAFPRTHAMWKMDYVQEHFELSNNDNNNLYINFLSAQLVPVVNPIDLATGGVTNAVVGVNVMASILLNEDPTYYKKLGIVYMDFPGSFLIYQILLRN